MRPVLSTLLIFAALMGASCRDIKVKQVRLNELFELAPGETAKLIDEPLEITLLPEIADSRCASDVVCIRAGEVVVRIYVKHEGTDVAPLTLAVPPGEPYSHQHVVGPYRIELKDVQPYPKSSDPAKMEDYRATFIVEKDSYGNI